MKYTKHIATVVMVGLPALVASTLGIVNEPASSSAQSPTPRPNILFVLTDDQPPSLMSAMPFTRGWLGRKYSNAVAQTPLCCPIRASILSGKQVHNHKVRTLDQAYNLNFNQTFPRLLNNAGYEVGFSGKLMNSWQVTDTPSKLGFTRWATTGGGYGRVPLNTDPSTNLYGATGPGQTVPVSQVDTITDASLRWLREWEVADGKPWMQYLATTAPHTPYSRTCTDKPAPSMRVTMAMRETNLSDKPPHVRDLTRMHTDRPLAKAWRAAWKTLSCVDQMMRRIHRELVVLGELENTLVVFTSDNGYQFGEHGLYGKREAYEASLRVPLRISWPAGNARLTQTGRIVGLLDFAPTFLHAARIRPTYAMDGRSLLAQNTRTRILIEHFAGGSHHQRVPTWAGWWRPGRMYRKIWYSGVTARYGAPVEEKYTDAAQMNNILARRRGNAFDRNWTAKARKCVGATCRWLENQ